jgi:GNAT superfamily N-acetyltransferase
MSTEINKSSHCYIGYIENNPVCFFAVLHFPHPSAKNIKKGHRLVVLPDYQGLGIGHKFSSFIADMYKKNGYRFIITSSTKSLYKQRSLDKKWIITRKGRTSNSTGVLKNTNSQNKYTYSYEYIG